MEAESSQCLVCNAEMPKSRIHYGGISCYSCRAFFRRTTQKENLKKCKFERKCRIAFQERKSCPPCRYEKCLRIGMRPDLVLDEDEKNQRFKKHNDSKTNTTPLGNESDQSEEDDEIQIIQDFVQNKRTSSNVVDETGRKYKKPSPWLKTDSGPSTSKQLFGILPWTMQESSGSDDEYVFPLPYEHISSSDSEDFAKNGDLLDPETGLGLGTNKKARSSFSTSISTSVIANPLKMKTYPPTEDVQIMKYTHKKFRKSRPDMSLIINNSCFIKKIKFANAPEKTNVDKLNLRAIRKSVIVRRGPPKPQLNLEIHINEHIEEKENIGTDENLVLSLNIAEIENMFTIEEERYLGKCVGDFTERWQEIPFGEEFVSEFVTFSDKRQTLSQTFFPVVNSRFRERILNFFFSGEEMCSLNMLTQFSILKANISKALMLVFVLGFNIETAKEEQEFVFNDTDLEQIRAQPPSDGSVKINELLKYIPLPESIKRLLYGLMVSCAHPILADRKVFVMMLMLVVFTGDDDPLVSRVSAQYWTMLRRYLTRRLHTGCTVDSLLDSIRTCLDTLPLMAKPFIQMEEARQ